MVLAGQLKIHGVCQDLTAAIHAVKILELNCRQREFFVLQTFQHFYILFYWTLWKAGLLSTKLTSELTAAYLFLCKPALVSNPGFGLRTTYLHSYRQRSCLSTDPSSLASWWQQQAPWGSPEEKQASEEQQEAKWWHRSPVYPETRLDTSTSTAWCGQSWRPQPEVKWGIRSIKASWWPLQPPQRWDALYWRNWARPRSQV